MESQNTLPAAGEKEIIHQRILDIFTGADEHDWHRVANAFSGAVLLDYSALSGGEPATLDKMDIINSWKGFLPKFQATHHQLGNFEITVRGGSAEAFFYGTATHYLSQASGGNTWTVVGSYNARLKKSGKDWKVNHLKLNLRFQDGNLDLPSVAASK